MTQQEKNEIRERYDSAKRSRTWKALDEADLSLGDIPVLLDALDAEEKRVDILKELADGLYQRIHVRDLDGVAAKNDRDLYKTMYLTAAKGKCEADARAAALERALRKHGTCASCIHTEKGIKDAPCNECVGKALCWEFDESRFPGGE